MAFELTSNGQLIGKAIYVVWGGHSTGCRDEGGPGRTGPQPKKPFEKESVVASLTVNPVELLKFSCIIY